jgi:hypothetical protein
MTLHRGDPASLPPVEPSSAPSSIFTLTLLVSIDLTIADLVERLDARALPLAEASARGEQLSADLRTAREGDHQDRSRVLCQIADWQRQAESLLLLK